MNPEIAAPPAGSHFRCNFQQHTHTYSFPPGPIKMKNRSHPVRFPHYPAPSSEVFYKYLRKRRQLQDSEKFTTAFSIFLLPTPFTVTWQFLLTSECSVLFFIAGALPMVTATVYCLNWPLKWLIIISYSLLCIWGLFKVGFISFRGRWTTSIFHLFLLLSFYRPWRHPHRGSADFVFCCPSWCELCSHFSGYPSWAEEIPPRWHTYSCR